MQQTWLLQMLITTLICYQHLKKSCLLQYLLASGMVVIKDCCLHLLFESVLCLWTFCVFDTCLCFKVSIITRLLSQFTASKITYYSSLKLILTYFCYIDYGIEVIIVAWRYSSKLYLISKLHLTVMKLKFVSIGQSSII